MIPVVRVLAPNPGPFTLEGTNTWVVGSAPAVVIDPGPDDRSHLAEVASAAGGGVAAILLTHGHEDHAAGAGSLHEMTGAPVMAARTTGGARPLPAHGEVPVNGTAVRVVPTPGHSSDHVAFWLEDERALLTGDAVLGRGTSVVDPPDGDLAEYVRSLRRMLDLRPLTIYPGHGPAVFGGVSKLEEYVEHRAERERQVLAALAGGATTPEELVSTVYPDVPQALVPAAARQVLAQLVKLEAEGRVIRADRGDRVRYRFAEPCSRCGRRPASAGSRFCPECGIVAIQEEPSGR